MGLRKHSFTIPAAMLAAFVLGCSGPAGESSVREAVVFKHGKVAGDPKYLEALLRQFEQETGITVKDETLPASTDEQHQFYVINLEGRSSDFDVLSMDVIWVPEFARAGWLRDVSHLVPEQDRSGFFPGPMQAVTYRGRLYAVPWYIDAGLLYYRTDLLERYHAAPPETWRDLVSIARRIMQKEDVYGYIWQGKQYEGLVCNVLEFLWGNGGAVLENGKVVIDSPRNVEALGFMRDLIVKYKVSPALVTTAMEEQTRHIFGNGRALFMRNWPYAWNIFERKGSPVRGKVGIGPLPSFEKGRSVSALGGWQLGVNAYAKRPEKAEELIRFLTRPGTQRSLARTLGYKPTRTSLYTDGTLTEEQPFLTRLYPVFMKARPRPVTPYYMMISQVMQPEFSAALSGIRTPQEALQSARKQIEHILGAEVP